MTVLEATSFGTSRFARSQSVLENIGGHLQIHISQKYSPVSYRYLLKCSDFSRETFFTRFSGWGDSDVVPTLCII